jgi:signal transduction histidine kinase/ligand-binding sensor domain-containing protein
VTIANNTRAAGAMGATPDQEFEVFNLYLRQMNRGVSPSPAPLAAFSIRVCLLAFLCAGLPTRAQYRYDVWTADNGLPQNIVRGIDQSPDGFLWVATFDGLVRFDGVQFRVFNKSNSPGMGSNRIVSLYGDASGDLWLSSEGGDLALYRNGTFQSMGAAQGVSENSVRGVTGDDAGRVWILNGDRIEEWQQDKGRFIDVTPAQLQLQYNILLWDNEGFWGSDETGIHCFAKGKFLHYALPPHVAPASILSVAHEHSGIAWVETSDRRYFKIPPGKTAVPVPKPLVTYVDGSGHSWSMQLGHELLRTVEYLNAGQTSKLGFVSMYEDREKNLWFGTEGKGLYRLQKQSIVVHSKQPGMTEDNIYPIIQDHSGAIWIGAWNMGLSRYLDGKFTAFTTAEGLPSKLVTALYEDNEGQLWVATHGGVAIFKDGHFHRPTHLSLPERSVVQAIYQDQNLTLWFGTNRGLVSWTKNGTKLFTVDQGLATDDVRVILQTRAGDLLVGGYGGLTRIRQGYFSHWTEREGLPSNNIRSLYEDNDGAVWIGTYDRGLGRFKDGAFTRFTMGDGLYNNGVFQILEDGAGSLWMSCNRGIYRVKKQELNDFAEGRRSTISSIAYGKVDGMATVECNGGLSPAGVKTRDGKLWFPTQAGVAVVDPAAVSYNPHPPPLVIESIVQDRTPVRLTEAIRLPPHAQNIEIQYSAPSFLKPEQIHFKYWLEGLDSSWVDAGGRRTAYYSHLPPGQYSFRVIAGNSDGVWNEAGARMAFTVLPAYYQTTWFRILCAAVFAVVLWAIYRLRLRQVAARMQARLEERLSERERIARDLHDTLLQGIVSAHMQLDVANDRLPGDSPAKPLVQRVLNLMEQVSAEGRNAIRSLRSSESERGRLDEMLAHIPDEMGAQKAVDFRVIVAGEPGDMHPVIRDEVYRISREATINAFRHANATSIEVEVEYALRKLGVTVRDNGSGIDAKLLQTGREGHWGLSNMRERAEKIHAKLDVFSRPGAGTEVQLSVPGKVAYDRADEDNWWKRLVKWMGAAYKSNIPAAKE